MHLAPLHQLVDLYLSDSQVTDAGLRHLANLTNLEFLTLSSRAEAGQWVDRLSITDAGIAHLSGLTKLQYLSLCNTHTTDAGLHYLSGMEGLQVLFLDNTEVSEDGIAELRQTLPDCHIKA